MLRAMLVALILIFVLEIVLFLWIGQQIGVGWTLLLILISGVVGVWFARKEGAQVLRLAQVQIENNDMPSEAIVDGICVLLGGMLLIVPGFITDLIGFFLVLPYTRNIFKAWLNHFFRNLIQRRTVGFFMRRR